MLVRGVARDAQCRGQRLHGERLLGPQHQLENPVTAARRFGLGRLIHMCRI